MFACIRGDLPTSSIRATVRDFLNIAMPDSTQAGWQSIAYARETGPQREVRFSETKLLEVVDLVGDGLLSTLDLNGLPPGKNPGGWRAYTASETLVGLIH